MKSKLPVQSKSRAILTNDVKYEIDSRRLLYFYHVAKYGSFSKAEAVLGVAQPAISRQINLLEKELDAELLIRHGRGVSMTAIGGILYKQAGVIFTEMELTVRMIDVEKKSPTGILSLAASAVAISVFMPDVVFSFMDNHPEVELTVIQASSGEVYHQLVSGKVDVGIIHRQPATSKIASEIISTEPMVLIVWHEHTLAGKRSVSLDQLQEIGLVLPSVHNGLRGTIDSELEPLGIQLKPHLQVDSIELIKKVIRRGDLATILPVSGYAFGFAHESFVAVPLLPTITRTLYVAYWANRYGETNLKELVRLIKQVYKRNTY